MKTPQDPDAAETVQTKEIPAVDPVATCSAWREVPKAEWDAWINERGAQALVNNCSEPPTLQARLNGEVIAIAKLYDGSAYHGGKNAQYLLPNS